MDTILILDFGSQTTQLIGRRIRDLGVYSEIFPGDTPWEELPLEGVKGIILSGSPFSVTDADAPVPDSRVYSSGLPLLGICYGLQRMNADQGGIVRALPTREYGRSELEINQSHPLFNGIPNRFTSWMSHGDSLEQAAPGFRQIAVSEQNFPAAVIKDGDTPMIGIQFHPEVTHCEYGMQILKNFTVGICGAAKEWNIDRYLEEREKDIRGLVGKKPVLLLISGGVDSTVVAAMLLKFLPPEQVHLMYIDTGLMRLGETEEVTENLEALGASHLHIVDAKDRFLDALKGITDPEEKRRVIGDMFITVQTEEIKAHIPADFFLAQGTLYTDMIESGKGVGKKAHVIKSHHNVRSPLIEKKRESGLLVEPLDRLYKDEVRRLGLHLGVSENIVKRHPFPGPGLGVRILGEITREKCDILRQADDIYIRELKKRSLYDEIWQAFSVLLPVRSVGVAGDAREYGYVLSLRAVTSSDGMTADVYPFPPVDLLEISSLITNKVKQVGRVVYDISSKPPSTIEWE
ncbi:MAG: glutamine-hydrolyzing GMP synthase [Spirochaetia bacterium]